VPCARRTATDRAACGPASTPSGHRTRSTSTCGRSSTLRWPGRGRWGLGRRLDDGTVPDLPGPPEVVRGDTGGCPLMPEHRRRRPVAALPNHAIEEMGEREMPVSILYPFSYRFCGKYGGEPAGLRRRSPIPMENLQPPPSTPGHTRRLIPDNWAVTDRLYRWVGHRHSGPALRDEEGGKRRLPGVGKCEHYAYAWYPEGSGKARAPVVYSVRPAPAESFPRSPFAHQLVAADGAAMRGIPGFLGRHDAQARDAKLDGPCHWEPGLHLPEPSLPEDSKPGFPVRVTGTEEALSRPTLRVPATAKPVLRVQGELAPWNQGRFPPGNERGRPACPLHVVRTPRWPRTSAGLPGCAAGSSRPGRGGLMEGAPKELAWPGAVSIQVRPYINDQFQISRGGPWLPGPVRPSSRVRSARRTPGNTLAASGRSPGFHTHAYSGSRSKNPCDFSSPVIKFTRNIRVWP